MARRVDPDAPLSDAQVRALVGLADASETNEWHVARELPFGWKPATYSVLAEMGLAKISWAGEWRVQITAKGHEMLATMGD